MTDHTPLSTYHYIDSDELEEVTVAPEDSALVRKLREMERETEKFLAQVREMLAVVEAHGL